jgi:hypothetical protein
LKLATVCVVDLADDRDNDCGIQQFGSESQFGAGHAAGLSQSNRHQNVAGVKRE